MNLTDPVADMLTRIRNACSAGHRRVDIPVSKLKTEVARLQSEIATLKAANTGCAGSVHRKAQRTGVQAAERCRD